MNFRITVFFLVAFFSLTVIAQDGHGRHFAIPDADGYFSLKCDFHIHTVFSDGLVWPKLRVMEAWNEGLDVIAITDHLEYRPFKDEISGDHNTSYDIASKANNYGIILIKGGEITRKMPPGHSNALFLKDNNLLDTPEWNDVFEEASKQEAFIFWTHPGWKAQQPDTMLWFEEHSKLLQEGKIHGIEIVNYKEYYPQAFQWALDKNLTIMGNSDIHGSVFQEFDIAFGEHRPITLVFACEKSSEGVRDALFDGRTAVIFNGKIFGKREWVDHLFHACVEVEPDLSSAKENSGSIFLTNKSDLGFELTPGKEAEKYGMIYHIDLPAHSTIKLTASGKRDKVFNSGQIFVFGVDNIFDAPDQTLQVKLKF
ncbi:MAG: histidinol-phosphatase [Lentimicrobium sp.]|nr:histidinol-phosphatase [Lentimicrobium sp.]